MVVISIKQPSPRVMSKLRNGHKVRIMSGEGISLALAEDKAREIMKKMRGGLKGVHIQLSPEELILNRSVSGNGIFSGLTKGASKAVSALEMKGDGFFDVVKSVTKTVAPIATDVGVSVAKDVAKSALKSAITGTGRPRGRPRKGDGFFDVVKSVSKTVAPIAQDVGVSVAKDVAKSALKSAITGTGRPRGRPRKGDGFFDVVKSVSKTVAPIASDVGVSVAKDVAKSALKSAITGTGRPRGRPRGEGSKVARWFRKAGKTIKKGFEKTFNPVGEAFEDFGKDIAGTAKSSAYKVGGVAEDVAGAVQDKAQQVIRQFSKEGQDVLAFGKRIGQDFSGIAEDIVGEFNRIKRTAVGRKINSAFAEVKRTFKKGGTAEQIGKGIASALIHQGIPLVMAEACGALAVIAFPEGGPASQLIGSKVGNALGVAIANKIGRETGYGMAGNGLAIAPRPKPIGLPRPIPQGEGMFEMAADYARNPFGRGMYAGSGLYAGMGLYAGADGRGLTVNTEGGTQSGVGRFSMDKVMRRNVEQGSVGRTLLSYDPLRSDPYGENFALSRTLPLQYQRLHHS
jgi:hypothetical protein